MAESMTHLGVQGHLVTVSSAEENQIIIDNLHCSATTMFPL
jgi:hypothetical protein